MEIEVSKKDSEKTMKYLRVTMPDGSRWDVPAETIARNKANHYADEPDEFENTMKDEDDLMDWAANNMNWSDVAGCAIKVLASAPVDFQEGWMNGEKEIVER